MRQLTTDGQRIVDDLAKRHGFSADAVTHMLFAVLHGNGSMAQFDHPELGGSGQWMSGGMTMIGDMFNGYLKGRIDTLCAEIAGVLASQPGLLQTGSFQSQSQSGSSDQYQAAGTLSRGESSLFVPDPDRSWWPKTLGSPSATGSQNGVRYACFAGERRLAVETGGSVWVYDTLDHQIGGFAQQQGAGGSITFTSQYGTVQLAGLPVVMRNGQPVSVEVAPPSAPAQPSVAPAASSTASAARVAISSDEIIAAIEKLGDLAARGVLTEDEFAAKKAELLSRL